jgi:hypothetical protein
VGKLDISLDVVLWFPDTVGVGGPRRFAEEVQAPPRWSARAFSAEQLAGMN